MASFDRFHHLQLRSSDIPSSSGMLLTAEGRRSGGGLGDTKVSPDETDSGLVGSGGKTGDSEPSFAGETMGDPVSSAVVGDEPVNSVFSVDEPVNSVFSGDEPVSSVDPM